jgi:hypothetical protein
MKKIVSAMLLSLKVVTAPSADLFGTRGDDINKDMPR